MLARFQGVIKQYYFAVIVILVIYALAVNEQVGKLCAGVAILLFGMLFLGEGFRAFSGGFLERVLAKYTNNAVKSIIFGTVATTIMQSSSLVSVLAISFVSASLIGLTQGIGVMFGANLGNTAGSWLIVGASSINISALALPLIVGGLLFNFQASKTYKGIGKVLAGLGFFFLGVFYIKAGFESFHGVMDLSKYTLDGYAEVFGFLLLGALITSIIQSSHATLAIIITAFLEQQISYTGALSATLGTSVGGVVTALVASLSANVDGRRLALANCMFNFTTVLIVAVFFFQFQHLNDFLGDAMGFAKTLEEGNSYLLRLAIFHTLFNLFGVVLLIGFIPAMAKLLTKLLKSNTKTQTISTPLFISEILLSYPDTAMGALNNEVKHLYDNAYMIISRAIGFHRQDISSTAAFSSLIKKKDLLKEDINVSELYNTQIKSLFNAIMDFSTKLQVFTTNKDHIERVVAIQIASRKIAEATKNVGLLERNMRKHSTGSNVALKKEYDDMRLDLGKLLRMIEYIKKAPKEDRKDMKKLLKEQKKFFKMQDREAFDIVESLIAKKAINAADGTSLLNDLSFINNVAKELIGAINHIYGLSKNTDIGKKRKKDKKKLQPAEDEKYLKKLSVDKEAIDESSKHSSKNSATKKNALDKSKKPSATKNHTKKSSQPPKKQPTKRVK
ncbi:Na/Pi cotransporter family protein [Helicobacter sp. T3_23-1059]